MRLVLLGPPGAGKGTQGKILAEKFGIPHVATGDIIRDHISKRTEFGCKVEAAIAAGNFATDDDINYWVSRRLSEPDALNGYILDGFPRVLTQAQAFRGTVDAVFWLDLPEIAAMERIAGRWVCPCCNRVYHLVHCAPHIAGRCDYDEVVLVKRPEDALDKMRFRLDYNRSQMWPVAEHYAALASLVIIDADGDAEVVTERILCELPPIPVVKLDF